MSKIVPTLAVLLGSVLLGLLTLQAMAAQEGATAGMARDVEAAEPSRQSSEAMARARRQAQGPLQRIRQASQLDRRAGGAPASESSTTRPPQAPKAPAADAPPLRPLEPAEPAANAIREFVEPLPVEVSGNQAAERSALPAPTVAAEVESPPHPLATETASASVPASPAVPDANADADLSSPTSAALVDTRVVSMPLPSGLSLLAPSNLMPPVAEPGHGVPEPAPRVIDLVQPALSDALLARLAATRGLTAELRLNADGSVADVQLPASVPRGAARALRSALAQWRFEPLPRAMVHRVELVFDR